MIFIYLLWSVRWLPPLFFLQFSWPLQLLICKKANQYFYNLWQCKISFLLKCKMMFYSLELYRSVLCFQFMLLNLLLWASPCFDCSGLIKRGHILSLYVVSLRIASTSLHIWGTWWQYLISLIQPFGLCCSSNLFCPLCGSVSRRLSGTAAVHCSMS